MFGQAKYICLLLAFCPAGEFGSPNCSLLSQRANSACRTAHFLVSGRIRLAERLAFESADEFGLPNCLLLGQRANSARRTARFWVSERIRLVERLAFGSADEFDLPKCLLLRWGAKKFLFALISPLSGTNPRLFCTPAPSGIRRRRKMLRAFSRRTLSRRRFLQRETKSCSPKI